MSLSKEDTNSGFLRMKLLGYYEVPINAKTPEVQFPKEAKIVCKLLDQSFNFNECIKAIGSECKNKLMNSELIFLNEQGKLLSYYAPKGIVKFSGIIFNTTKIKRLPKEYQFYFTLGEPFAQLKPKNNFVNIKQGTKVRAKIIDIVIIKGLYHYKLSYAGYTCFVELLPFEAQILKRIKQKKTLDCVYKGFDDKENLILEQDTDSYIDDLYEEDTFQKFTYVNSAYELNGNEIKEYHWIRDSYGIKHRYDGDLSEEQKTQKTEFELYVRGIDSHTKRLILTFQENQAEDSVLENDQFVVGGSNSGNIPDKQNIDTIDIDNESHADNDKRTHEQTFIPLKLNILGNGSVVINEAHNKANIEKSVVEILVKDYAKNGLLIMVDNQGCICKIPISSITQLGCGIQIDNCVNPNKLSRYFVIPSDCIIGLIIITNIGKYVEMWNTSDIPSSKLENIEYQKSHFDKGQRHQAFILPLSWDIDKYCRKCIKDDRIPYDVKELLKSYGVFI